MHRTKQRTDKKNTKNNLEKVLTQNNNRCIIITETK